MGTARYGVASEVASRIIDGDVAIIHLDSGMYYDLDGASALAWALLERHHSLAEVSSELSARFSVDSRSAMADVEQMVEQLVREELLVELTDGVTPVPVDADISLPATYCGLHIERYSDMSELLALDPPMPELRELPLTPVE